MKRIIQLLIILFFVNTVLGQTRRMTNPELGRTYASETQTRTIHPLLMEAERRFRALDYEGTFFTLENAVEQNPQSPEALIMRARFKKMVGLQTESEMDLRLANRINPYAASLYGYHGQGGLLKILALEPDRSFEGVSTLQRLNYYYQKVDKEIGTSEDSEQQYFEKIDKVIEHIELDFFDDALIDVNELLVNFPKSAIAYDLKGVILQQQGKFHDAQDAFEKAIAIEPEFAIAWYNLGRIERSLGNFEKAKANLDKAIELQGNLTKAYFERALLSKQMGDKESALEDYNSVINKNGNTSMEAFLNRGLTKKILGDYGGALADLNQVIDEFPDNAALRKNRGNLHLLFGLHRKAIDDYSAAIALDNNYAEAYYNRAVAFFLLYDKISACNDLDRSIDLGYEIAEEMRRYSCTE